MHLPSAHTVLAVRSALVVGVLGMSTVLAACGGAAVVNENTTSSAEETSAEDDTTDALGVVDPWVKATDESMTAAFGTLTNETDAEIAVVGATSDAAGVVELHEVVTDETGASVMQPKEGGFTIPAGGTHELTAGGDHLMLMDLARPLEAGEEVVVTLELSDGSTQDVTALVKPFSGADETYAGGEGHEGHDDHSGHADR